MAALYFRKIDPIINNVIYLKQTNKHFKGEARVHLNNTTIALSKNVKDKQ